MVFPSVVTMLHLILLESPLELVPPELAALKQVQSSASRRKKKPHELLLDQALHGKAMLRLDDHERRGRPDIVYLSLMALMETPLCKIGMLQTYIHLQDGRVIEVNPAVRLPRNYSRFIGLFEQLLLNGRVPPTGDPLLQIHDMSLEDLLTRLRSTHSHSLTILASESGQITTMNDLLALLPEDPLVPVIVGVGAFPHGDFSPAITHLFETHVSLDPEVMMAWHVCSEILWTYTLRHNIIQKRFTL